MTHSRLERMQSAAIGACRARAPSVRGLLATLFFVSATAVAQAPRLELITTEPIGQSSGSQCVLPDGVFPEPSASGTTLSERDVVRWEAWNATWTLDSQRFPAGVAREQLADRCFVLAIDGKPIVSGLALPVDSGHLTGYPALNVIPRNGEMVLQLTLGNHHHIRLMHEHALDAVLGNQANLANELALAKLTQRYEAAAQAWVAAVNRLVAQKAIRRGVSVEEVIAQLGAPTSSSTDVADKALHVWYFDSPMHVNPTFSVEAVGGTVSNFAQGSR